MLRCTRYPCGLAAYAGAMRLRSTWTDSRLDDLNGRVSDLSNRVDGLQQTMINGFLTLVVIMVIGFMGLAGLIITKV
jgi:hypothetical protein